MFKTEGSTNEMNSFLTSQKVTSTLLKTLFGSDVGVAEAVALGLLEARVFPGHALDVLPPGQAWQLGRRGARGVEVQLLGVAVAVGVVVILLARHLKRTIFHDFPFAVCIII